MRLSLSVTLCALWAAWCWAGPDEEAKQLKEEANAILQKGSGVTLDPKEYAECVVKLERALDLLEKANRMETDLAVEVNNALYWARKFTTMNIINEVQKAHGGSGDSGAARKPPPPKEEPKKKEEPKVEGADELGMAIAEQRRKYEEGERFESKHSGDDYAIALNWFKTADQLAGTDYSVKALAKAREAQERFAKKQGTVKEPELPDTPAMKLVKEADALVAQGSYEKAFDVYRKSIQTENTLVANRRLAHAYFSYAQKAKDKLMPQFEAADQKYRDALAAATLEQRFASGRVRRYINWRDPNLQRVVAEIKKLRSEALDALKHYDQAASYFRSTLNLAPNKSDLDAAGHYALCHSVKRADASTRIRSIQLLNEFLGSYKPGNDIERTLYAFCESELEDLRKPVRR